MTGQCDRGCDAGWIGSLCDKGGCYLLHMLHFSRLNIKFKFKLSDKNYTLLPNLESLTRILINKTFFFGRMSQNSHSMKSSMLHIYVKSVFEKANKKKKSCKQF